MSTRLDVRFLAGTQPVGYAIAVAATVARRMLSDARTVEAQAPPLTLQVHDLRTLVSPIVKMRDRARRTLLDICIQVDARRDGVFPVHLTREFQDWLDGLRDQRAQVRIAERLRLAEAGSLGVWKSVRGELSEMGIDVGHGYRLYFTRRGRILIVMLAAAACPRRRVTSAVRSGYSLGWSWNHEEEDQRETESRALRCGALPDR